MIHGIKIDTCLPMETRVKDLLNSKDGRHVFLNLTLEPKETFVTWGDVFPDFETFSPETWKSGKIEFVSPREAFLRRVSLGLEFFVSDPGEKHAFRIIYQAIENRQKCAPLQDRLAVIPESQVQDGKYRVDFLYLNSKISDLPCIIEIDGRTHFEPKTPDTTIDDGQQRMKAFTHHTQRDRDLRADFHVTRFTALEVEDGTFASAVADVLGI